MELEYQFTCPHCWQTIVIMLDLSAGGQEYIQDCEVCCNPIEIDYDVCNGRISSFEARGIDQ